MNIAEESLKLLRESQESSEESNYMNAYSIMVVEVNKMREELNSKASVISQDVYETKLKRVKDLEKCLVLFSECYFKMLRYKQEMVVNKHKLIDKELEFVNFVTKGLEDEYSRVQGVR